MTQHDLHFTPEVLSSYDCVAIVGHDEYWTWEMRDAIDAFVEGGGGVARFAGNFAWQVRFENDGEHQVCYKSRARSEDPLFGTSQNERTTNFWDSPEVARPGTSTFGLTASGGPYAGWQGNVIRGARGFPIYRPEHWAFANTGLFYGDVLGAESHIFGYEVDGIDYEIRNGLPYPSDTSGAPDNLEILAVGLASWAEWANGLDSNDFEFGDEEVRGAAGMLHSEVTEELIEKMKRGSGMMVNFSKGAGDVFNAGSCEWVAGLLRQDPMVELVTSNVLNRYLHRE